MVYSVDLRERRVKAVKAGEKHEGVAKRCSLGIASVRRYLEREKQGMSTRCSAWTTCGHPQRLLSKQVRTYPAAPLERQGEAVG
ncbi:MAG: IS630 transposase-related protein [Trueperaceae bacterium]